MKNNIFISIISRTLYVVFVLMLGLSVAAIVNAQHPNPTFSQRSSVQNNFFAATTNRIIRPRTKLAVDFQSQAQLTSAVSKADPAVVSIEIYKNMPQYQMLYIDPFGNSGIEIPIFDQVGFQKQKVGGGSGMIISHNGYILTNNHVVSDTQVEYTAILLDGTEKKAQVVYQDPTHDIAIIQIDGNYPTIASLGDSSTLQPGQSIIAIGNVLGQYHNSISTGIVSGLNRSIQAERPDPNGNANGTNTIETLDGLIQIDAPIYPGNSGGPLLDINGNVIGINVAAAVNENNIGFSIPINNIKDSIKNYVS